MSGKEFIGSSRARLVLYLLAPLLAILILAYFILGNGFAAANNPSGETYPIRGVDLSHHQGQIDWDAVAKSGQVRFAYLKASEGRSLKDRQFIYNWRETQRVGIPRGGYHFFSLCRDGLSQAQNFVQILPVEKGTLPYAIDLEFEGNCAGRPSPEILIEQVNVFIDFVARFTPQKPVLYVSDEFFDQYLANRREHLRPHVIWRQSVSSTPSGKACEDWHVWQFDHQGRIEGIKGDVGLDVFCGSDEAFRKWAAEFAE